MSRNRIDRAAEQAEVQLIRIGDQQVDQSIIDTSLLFRDLREVGLPVEIARIMGLHDIRTAMSFQMATRQTIIALEWAKAELRVEIFKAERRAKGEAEAAIGLAAADYWNQVRPTVTIKSLSASESTGPLYTIAASAIGSVAARTAVSLDGTGQAVPGDPTVGREPPVGLAKRISGNSVEVALPGDVISGFSSLQPGRLYYPGPGGLLQLQALGTPPIGRALDATTLVVLDTAQPHEVVTALSAIEAGAPVYWDATTGKYAMCDNSSAIKADACGIALDAAVGNATFRLAPPGSRLNPKVLNLPSSLSGPYAYVGATAGTYGNAPGPGLYLRPVVRLYSNPATIAVLGGQQQNWTSAIVLDRAPVQVGFPIQ
jgi:hypothetical protein